MSHVRIRETTTDRFLTHGDDCGTSACAKERDSSMHQDWYVHFDGTIESASSNADPTFLRAMAADESHANHTTVGFTSDWRAGPLLMWMRDKHGYVYHRERPRFMVLTANTNGTVTMERKDSLGTRQTWTGIENLPMWDDCVGPTKKSDDDALNFKFWTAEFWDASNVWVWGSGIGGLGLLLLIALAIAGWWYWRRRKNAEP